MAISWLKKKKCDSTSEPLKVPFRYWLRLILFIFKFQKLWNEKNKSTKKMDIIVIYHIRIVQFKYYPKHSVGEIGVHRFVQAVRSQGSNLFVCGDHNAGTRHSEPKYRRWANHTRYFISYVFAQRHRGKGHIQGNFHAWADKTFGWCDGQTSTWFICFPAETG